MWPSDSSRCAASRAAAMQSGWISPLSSGLCNEQADAQPARFRADLLRCTGRDGAGAATVSPTTGPCNASRTPAVSRTDRVTHSSATSRVVEHAVVGHQRRATARRLQPDEPATTRGNADRAAAVVGVADGDHAARDRGRGTAARTARRLRRVPRITRRPVRKRLGSGNESEFGRVRAADDDEARVEVLLRERVGLIVFPVRVAQELHALVDRIALDAREQILEHERHAAERSVRQFAPGLLARLVEQRMDHRVQLAVQFLDAVDGFVDQFERRRLTASGRVRPARWRRGRRRAWRSPTRRAAGRRSAHGIACSSCAATRIKTSSRNAARDELHADRAGPTRSSASAPTSRVDR